MSSAALKRNLPDYAQLPDNIPLPDHTQLPDEDGTFVDNFQEHPQSVLLTDSIKPILRKKHPDGHYCIGQDCGIYWRLPQEPEPLYRGAVAPDWFYVPDREPEPEGVVLRSYVMWQEKKPPLLAIEFASEDGSKERDATPRTGKFWIYERQIRIPYYAIFVFEKGDLEVYRLVRGRYRRQRPNQHGHYPIPELGVGLGVWQGEYLSMEVPWLRWYDDRGRLLPTNEEQISQERQDKQQALRQVKEERRAKEEAIRRAERLAEQLRALGIDPDA